MIIKFYVALVIVLCIGLVMARIGFRNEATRNTRKF